jgi:hypothetical protein
MHLRLWNFLDKSLLTYWNVAIKTGYYRTPVHGIFYRNTYAHLCTEFSLLKKLLEENSLSNEFQRKVKICMYMRQSSFLEKLISTRMYFFVIILNISLSDKATTVILKILIGESKCLFFKLLISAYPKRL